MAQNRGGGIRNELIELATAFYSLVDAGAAQRGVSHRAGDGGGRARGESISWEGGEGGGWGARGSAGCVFRSQIASASLFRSASRRFSSVVPARGRHAGAAQYGLKGEKRAKTTRRALSLRSH